MVAGASVDAPSLPYHEPGIVTILIQTSFLLLLNIVNAALDRVLYCGLLGQVLVGIAWGTPGAKWLSTNMEETIVQLGYLGLMLLVFEGGLHTSFQSLRANLLLSSGVALTGIVVPIGLSYTLQGLLNATPLQAFAAGAALCSTSLGTTFTVLGSSGLSSSQLGVVLTSAAIMDDVVGLVMVQVISNLGGESFSWIVVVRPVLVSVAFAVFAPVLCLLAMKPATLLVNNYREAHPKGSLNTLLCRPQTAFVLHTVLLIGLVVGATYAGTSNLFAAYIAGAVISWWDSELPHPTEKPAFWASVVPKKKITAPTNTSGGTSTELHGPGGIENSTRATPSTESEGRAADVAETQCIHALGACSRDQDTSGAAIYHRYYRPAVTRFLQPLFFASIGFSIPITRMFRGAIVWRGIIYTVLMALSKIVCGLWLVRFSIPSHNGKLSQITTILKLPSVPHFWGCSRTPADSSQTRPDNATEMSPSNASNHDVCSSPTPPKPFSLHPPIILALAMCARGEIGFLISGVAESNGIFASAGDASTDSSDLFLVVTWAIVLCTIIGPLGVGLAVRRVRTLQERKNALQEGAGRDVLGVWGVE